MKYMKPCLVFQLGTIAYDKAIVIQEHLTQAVLEEKIPDCILLLQHPHVITMGRFAKYENILFSESRLKEKGVALSSSSRGGDVTYHGPGQLIGYPIMKLRDNEKSVRQFVMRIETSIIQTLARYHLIAECRDNMIGVWIKNEKIAAIGIRVSRWVSSHGFALNISTDLSYFQMIIPCGLAGMGVTSMEKKLEQKISIENVTRDYIEVFAEVFQRNTIFASTKDYYQFFENTQTSHR